MSILFLGLFSVPKRVAAILIIGLLPIPFFAAYWDKKGKNHWLKQARLSLYKKTRSLGVLFQYFTPNWGNFCVLGQLVYITQQ